MDTESREPNATPVLSAPPSTVRHDGWTGERMAIFCETLAETAVVAEACDQAGMGISGAYAHRRRNPFFAAAWDAALTIARERLADTLLARSMEGNVEQIYRDGELVGERHVLDNRLGLQILRRLDRMADAYSCGGRNPVPSKTLDPRRGAAIDWNLAVDALRTGDDEGVARALALIESNEVEEVEGDPNLPLQDAEPQPLDLSDRCWAKDEMGDKVWMTDFPPPADFDGYQKGEFGSLDYERECTPAEAELLEAGETAARVEERADEDTLRDAWFEMLREELSSSRHSELVSASIVARSVSGGQASTAIEGRGEDDQMEPEPDSA